MLTAIAIWTTLRGWASAGWKWASESATHLLMALCAVLTAYALWERHRANMAEAALARVVSAIKQASATATADQIAVNHKPAAISAAIAKVSDAQAPAYYRRALSVADAHRVRPAPARGTGGADLPRADHPAPIDDGSPAPADLVCRAKSDDDLIVNAASRGAQMRADTQAMIDAGIARASQPTN